MVARISRKLRGREREVMQYMLKKELEDAYFHAGLKDYGKKEELITRLSGFIKSSTGSSEDYCDDDNPEKDWTNESIIEEIRDWKPENTYIA